MAALDDTSDGREHILILGGGCGAMAAAFALTDREEDRQRYRVSIVQPGWRLGGKGASGRNAAMGQRIEEHGLHIWSGFYENAFWMMRKCYEELDRPSGAPLASVFSAFRPRHYTGMTVKRPDGSWDMWKGHLPHEAGLPGDSIARGPYEVVDPPRTPWELFSNYVPWVLRYLQATAATAGGDDVEKVGGGQWWLYRLFRGAGGGGRPWYRRLIDLPDQLFLGVTAWRVLRAFAAADRFHAASQPGQLPRDREAPEPYRRLSRRLHCLQWWVGRKREQWQRADTELTMLFDLMEVFLAVLRGMLDDNLIERGFAHADAHGFSAWLQRHGASKQAADSPTMEALYCYIFAYENGDPQRPSVAAGTALRFAFRLVLCSRGAVFWEMGAGMGDAVFAPLYEVLRRRGVEFHFFHRGAELRCDAQGRLSEVVVERQVRTRSGGAYEPLVDVKGLPCWPSQPQLDQLQVATPEDAARLLDRRRELETAQATWPGSEPLVLEVGRHVKHVVLATSIEPLRSIAPSVLAHSPALRQALEHIRTVATVGLQLWTRPSTENLGWRSPAPLITSYGKPFDTWADMSHTLAVEHWGCTAPRSVQYLCGALHEQPGAHTIDQAALEQMAMDWLKAYAGELWPRAVSTGSLGAAHGPLRSDVLWSPGGRPAVALQQQWVIANVEPAERYVQSLPGTSRYRIRADATGIPGLLVAGDWLKTGLDYGCVESAVIGGLQAARAICGYPGVIHGENDFTPRPNARAS